MAGKFYYDWKKKFFLLWRESLITTGKEKVLVICLAGCAVVSVFGSGDYDQKKKVLVLCNKFVLVLVKIDLIIFEHTICISST